MKDLYPELIDYVFQHCWKFFNDLEQKAINHHAATIKFKDWPDINHPKLIEIRERNLTTDEDALALLENGYIEFIINTSTRIYMEHKHEIYFNLCPKCSKIARTPKAQQCRFCLHDWH